MTPEALLTTCNHAGITLRLEGGKVKARGNEQAIARLLPILRAHKEALKAVLTDEQQEFYDERAAIAEFDGGLSRADAEAQASKEFAGAAHSTNIALGYL